jgi:hypothetical protein
MESHMTMFRAGHNKPRPRLREPLMLEEPRKPLRKIGLGLLLASAALAVAFMATQKASAHPRGSNHVKILNAPIAGVRNNYWYDYKSDIEEAESELRKDLRRAKSEQDEREAWREYNRELLDARGDYRKEMIEKGYIRRRGVVTVGG